MLYNLLKPLIRIFLKTYFRSLEVFGLENIPDKGPVIYVANHPSAAIDPILIAVSLKEKLFFLAAAEFFGKGLQKTIFKNQFNMIPVYRPWKNKDQKTSNEDMFKDCYTSLGNGNSILLFPEATSETISKIRDLKTGAIRIKMGFENLQKNIEVPIIPIGLSYTNPHEFQSKVVLKIGKPIEFSPKDENTEIGEVYREKTLEIQKALEDCIIHIENFKNESLVKKVNRLFANFYRNEKDLSPNNRLSNFEFKQSIARAASYFENKNPDKFKTISARINNYFKKLEELKVSNDSVERSGRDKPSLFRVLFLLLGFPFFLLGVFYFLLPYQLTKFIYQNKIRGKLRVEERDDMIFESPFRATLIFGVGAVFYLIWSMLTFLVLGFSTKAWILSLLITFCVYPFLRFLLYYSRVGYRANLLIKSYFAEFKHKTTWSFLVKEREELVEVLNQYQTQYEKETA